MDFTLSFYRSLLSALQDGGYSFLTFEQFITSTPEGKMAVLRHDVDLLPQNSSRVAKIEAEMGVVASYYFRAVPESWDEGIIREIAALGHEVGYHYESLTTCRGDEDEAYSDFCGNLEKLRKIAQVQTICIHGSPRSPYDSKDIWKKYSYKELGIIGEPYLDIDFSKTFYLTDTGRRWDGYKSSICDKIPHYQEEWNRKWLAFHTTKDIIKAIDKNTFPDVVMITTHPQRWNPFGAAWLKELLLQNVKNVVKRVSVCRSR